MNSSDGIRLAEVINDFSKNISELGPLGAGEGLDVKDLKAKLDAVRKLVPYIRLVERERLRVPIKTEAAYRKFFDSQDVNGLIDELIIDKMKISQIISLLHEKPLSTREIADSLRVSPSEVSRHLGMSSKQGLIKYDEGLKRYAVA